MIRVCLAVADAAQQRRAVKTVESGEEDPPPAEEVAEATGQQEDAAEGDEVGVDDPGQARLAEAEVALDGGQGDVHDRRVEDDHEHPGAQDREREPAAVAS